MMVDQQLQLSNNYSSKCQPWRCYNTKTLLLSALLFKVLETLNTQGVCMLEIFTLVSDDENSSVN
jgi:hypothetical protein